MQIELLPTSIDQLPLIANLYQFYAYESSDWEQEDVEVDGRFYIHAPHLQRYWQEADWSAQLILVDGFIAGFLLIERSELPGVDALEFADLFILKKYRRLGIGRALVEQVMVAGGGSWVVSFYQQDSMARQFWHKVLSQLPLRAVMQAADPAQPGLLTYRLEQQRH
ncbi:GNAT family N-acetyltransferase [Pseudomonas sp. 8AS]|uniref:GNAT family N-acetyltransferase n=1 Tax=Pseudomonas sp. 8AS TaxID=2653163 RepID=UPI0012F457EF|nr:GNAT family N-acetyltransferase [Pseudomonas sp. 8AS]VXB25750.1 GNAT family N-acetyltransferase [Pseudomonas sp. 8AS]